MLDYTLCNELLARDGLSLDRQARVATELGYAGLELAPHTLSDQPHRLRPSEVATLRRSVEAAGARVTGFHWLLSGYPQASITDRNRWAETQGILTGLIEICADLGGRVLVHGSPQQRVRPAGVSDAELLALLAEFFAPIAQAAEAAGVRYCIEPLAADETATLTSIADGAALARAVDSPAFATMIDCKAAGRQEPPVAACIRHWGASGVIGHIHANDTNLGAPGMGNDPFHDIVAALLEIRWAGLVGVEPFRTCVDGTTTAAIGIATLRACERALR